jgi:site-specific recombinase XerD
VPAPLQDLHRSFARHLRAEGRSDRTVTTYGQAITYFSRWLEAQDRTATLDELTRASIREWLAQLADVHEASTVKTRYRGLFWFCGWLVDETRSPKTR